MADILQDQLFDIRVLRLLYGKAPAGQSNRQEIKITITPETKDMIQSVVPFGNGRYGSSMIELSIRLLLSLVSNGEDLDTVSSELRLAVSSPYLTSNLRRLIKYLES